MTIPVNAVSCIFLAGICTYAVDIPFIQINAVQDLDVRDGAAVEYIPDYGSFRRDLDHPLISSQALLGHHDPLLDGKPVTGAGRIGNPQHLYTGLLKNEVDKGGAVRLAWLVIGQPFRNRPVIYDDPGMIIAPGQLDYPDLFFSDRDNPFTDFAFRGVDR